MAQVQIPGIGAYLPWLPYITIAPAFTSAVIDATGEKFAYCGRVWRKDRAGGDISKVGFRFGSVTKAGGSGLTVSLQDITLTAGAPMQPDETQDQTVAVANANAAFATNTWLQTAALSANRTVAFGELLGVVVEFDGSGRQGADSVAISMLNAATTVPTLDNVCSHKTGAWAALTAIANVILEFSDGVFGTLIGGFPCSDIGTLAYKQDTAVADEHALEFQVPMACKVDGFWVLLDPASNAGNFDVILYDGTTPMTNGSVSIDANAIGFAGSIIRIMEGTFPGEVTLAANTTYRLAFKPTQTTANLVLQYFDMSAAGHLQAHGGGTTWALASRIDAGAWASPVTTRRPMAGLRLSSFDDGAGGAPSIGQRARSHIGL